MPAPRALRRRALASVAPLLAASATAQPPAPASPQQFKLEYGANSLVFTGNLNLSVDHTEVTGQPAASPSNPNPALAPSVNRVFGGNASRVTLVLARDFGNGYRGEGFIDSSVVPTSGSGTLAGRENWLGYSGPFGRIRAGRIDTPVKQMGGYTDVFYSTGISDDGQIEMMGGEDQLTGFTRRQQKALRYDMPAMNGFNFGFELALPNADGAAVIDQPSTAAREGQVISTALTYANGGFSAGLGLEQHRNLRFTIVNGAASGLTDRGIRFGAKYVVAGIGDIALGANLYQYGGPSGTKVRRPFAGITANAYVGPGKIVMRYERAGEVGGSAPDGTVICGAINSAANWTSCSGALQLRKGAASGASQVVLGYDLPINRQTNVYFILTGIRNEAHANYNYATNNYGVLNPGSSLKGAGIGSIYYF